MWFKSFKALNSFYTFDGLKNGWEKNNSKVFFSSRFYWKLNEIQTIKHLGMATIRRFEELDAWKLSRDLCKHLGRLIDKGNFTNNYKIIGQMEGASGSIMDNIAEGFERGTRAEFIQFLGYSKGSCGELRSQLYRVSDRGYITKEEFDELYSKCVRISIMLQKFISYLQKTKILGERKRGVGSNNSKTIVNKL